MRYTEHRGATGRRLAQDFTEVTAQFARPRRLLLFVGLQKQAANAYDNKAKC